MTVALRLLPALHIARRRLPLAFTSLPVATGLVVIVVALLALVGWISGVEILSRFVPGSDPVKVNAATALLLLGTALVLAQARSDRRWTALAVAALAFAAAAVGAVTLVEWVFNVDLGIDQALIAEAATAAGTPGRMAPTSAAGLVLLSGAILLARLGDPWPRLRQGLSALVLLLALFFLVAMTQGLDSPFADDRLSITPVPTALAFLAAGIGCLALRAGSTPLALIAAPGALGHMARRLLAASVLTPLILGTLAAHAETVGWLRPQFGTAFIVASTVLVGSIAVVAAAGSSARRSTQIERADTALRASEERNRLLLASLPQSVLFKDRAGHFVSVNDVFAAGLGLTPDDIVGRTDHDLYPAGLADAYREADLEVMRSRQPVTFEEANVAGGERRIVETTKAPVIGDDGEVQGILCLFTDVTERRQAEQSRALLASIVESADDAIMSGTLDGIITSWNSGAERMYGWAAAEAIGQPATLVSPADRPDQVAQLLARARRGEQVEHHETERVRKDGRELEVSVTVSPIMDTDGAPKGVSIIARDISEQKRAQAKVQRAKAELERSNRELQEFASVASHDLQEPLRKIRAFGDRLARSAAGTLGEDSRADLERIQGAAARMQALIDDLLEYALVTTRARPFRSVDLEVVAAEVMGDLAARIEETGGRVEVGPLPTIEADPTQMRQLLQNLMGNGLKFHREGVPPLIRLGAAPAPGSAGSGGSIALTVSDNGIGFEARHAERIFAPFERLHGRTAYEGTGIGLAICHKIVERHAGDIVASGRPGEGATFTITLPLRQATPAGHAVAA